MDVDTLETFSVSRSSGEEKVPNSRMTPPLAGVRLQATSANNMRARTNDFTGREEAPNDRKLSDRRSAAEPVRCSAGLGDDESVENDAPIEADINKGGDKSCDQCGRIDDDGGTRGAR